MELKDNMRTIILECSISTTNIFILDCSEPFVVRHSSDDVSDQGGIVGHAVANTLDTGVGRGTHIII